MADNNFDPDTFDWGDGSPGIKLDDIGDDIHEALIKAALDAQEESYGWRYLRRSERKEGAGRVYRNRYHMPAEGIKWAEEEFPGYTFIWDGALGHHDHPVAHLATELNEIEMVSDIVDKGDTYIDLFGNGNRDAKYKRKCIMLYKLITPADYIRHQNPTVNSIVFDMETLCNPNHVLGKINRVTLTHALYYVSMGDVARIVHTSQKRKLSALVHRHKDTHGFLNHGEQEYWVSETGIVTQENVATGEKYSHPSLEALFHQSSAKTSHGGVAWTIRKAGGDSFIIDFVACPNEICEVYVPLQFLKPETCETFEYNSVKVKKFLSWTWITATRTTGKVVLEDIDLYNKLRRYVSGKQRTARLKVEVTNQARRLCNKEDIISIHGGGASDILVAHMTDYVEVAFYVDARKELDAAISFHKQNADIVASLNKYYETGASPRDFTAVTQMAVKTTKTFSDAAVQIIDGIRTTSSFSHDDYRTRGLPPGENEECLNAGTPGSLPGPWW